MPAMTSAAQCKFMPDAILVFLASHAHDPDNYIRTYGDFFAGLEGHPARREA